MKLIIGGVFLFETDSIKLCAGISGQQADQYAERIVVSKKTTLCRGKISGQHADHLDMRPLKIISATESDV